MVLETGIEPVTPCSSGKCYYQLSYSSKLVAGLEPTSSILQVCCTSVCATPAWCWLTKESNLGSPQKENCTRFSASTYFLPGMVGVSPTKGGQPFRQSALSEAIPILQTHSRGSSTSTHPHEANWSGNVARSEQSGETKSSLGLTFPDGGQVGNRTPTSGVQNQCAPITSLLAHKKIVEELAHQVRLVFYP